MRFLVNASGSYGDLYPFIAIGRELARRGHGVLLFTSAAFGEDVRKAGLEHVAIGTAQDYDTLVRHPQAFDPKHGFRVILEATLAHLSESCRLLERAIRPGGTILVGSTLALGTRLVAEKHGLPVATAHLSPAVLRSVHDSPAVGDSRLPPWLPAPFKRLAYRAIDRLFVDPMIAPGLNRVRRELGLEPVERVFDRWIHDADRVIGLFPDWFAPRQDDWPPHVRLTGFPLYDASEETALSEELEAFLRPGAGEPPVVLTAGTAAVHEAEFFRTSIEACRRSGRRGLLLTKYPEQLPERLPDGFRHFDYVPFSKVLPRSCVLVHHGGIGTSSQALAAGIPQLVRPLAFDQYDNALRLQALGTARWIWPREFNPATVSHVLDELAQSRTVEAACRRFQDRLRRTDAVAATCDALEGGGEG